MNGDRAPLPLLLAAAAATIPWAAGCGVGESPGAPGGLRADFSYDPPNPRVGVPVTYSGAVASGDISGYRWDLDGDGSFDTGFRDVDTVSHVYEQSGVYRVTLQVRGTDGEMDAETREVPIRP
ncbi:MAG: PKD domain-containing protein [Gemmatimonadota bacterium]